MSVETVMKIGNIEIVVINNEKKSVPIKPICAALGIDFSTQLKKFKSDDDYRSYIGFCKTISADGIRRSMCCVELGFMITWLYTISLKNVTNESKMKIRTFRKECYKILNNSMTIH